MPLYALQLIHTKQRNTMDRQELQSEMINQVIEDMDLNTMWAVLADFMSESYDKYSDAELTEEVKEYYPHLLED